jgi:hypothetical protein
MRMPGLMLLAVVSCTAPPPSRELDLAVAVEPEDMAAAITDLAIEPDVTDLTLTIDMMSTCAAMAGQACCPATAEESATLPTPPGAQQKGVGRCAAGFACAQANCPPRTACADGSFNSSSAAIRVVYCVSL